MQLLEEERGLASSRVETFLILPPLVVLRVLKTHCCIQKWLRQASRLLLTLILQGLRLEVEELSGLLAAYHARGHLILIIIPPPPIP